MSRIADITGARPGKPRTSRAAARRRTRPRLLESVHKWVFSNYKSKRIEVMVTNLAKCDDLEALCCGHDSGIARASFVTLVTKNTEGNYYL